jgi:hypothetical protein
MRTRSVLFFSIIILYLIGLGYLRDHLFVHINYQIYKLLYNSSFDYRLPPDMKWLERFSYTQLYYGKFPLTLLFSFLYFLPTLLVVKRIFPEKKFTRYTVSAYLCIFTGSLLIYMLGYVCYKFGMVEFQKKTYSVSRYIMGYMQSPLLLMILVLAFKISTSKDTGKSS